MAALLVPATYRKISKVEYKIPDSVSPDARDLIQRVRPPQTHMPMCTATDSLNMLSSCSGTIQKSAYLYQRLPSTHGSANMQRVARAGAARVCSVAGPPFPPGMPLRPPCFTLYLGPLIMCTICTTSCISIASHHVWSVCLGLQCLVVRHA